MTLAYYPGCAPQHSSAALGHSTCKVLAALGVDYKEVPDWTCCGSTPAPMMEHLTAHARALPTVPTRPASPPHQKAR